MKLNVNFKSLFQAVKIMGAKKVDFDIGFKQAPVDPIDLQLLEGMEIALEDLESEQGLLSVHGRQVLLYIQDHGAYIKKALDNGKDGNKFHVADCSTLRNMRDRGRFQRYVVKNDIRGNYFVSGTDPQLGYIEGKTSLNVCQNCLKLLNFKGFNSLSYPERRGVVGSFSLATFFSTYSSFFSHYPTTHEGEAGKNKYTEDWPSISGQLRAERHFTCEQCHVDLTAKKSLLHVHHINGVKHDNDKSNLKVLCADCHSKEVQHEHLFVKHADRQMITRLRKEQGVIKDRTTWKEVKELIDPGLYGLIVQCEKQGSTIPIVGYEVQNSKSEIVSELELAWPNQKKGIAIGEQDRAQAIANGWRIYTMIEVIENTSLLF